MHVYLHIVDSRGVHWLVGPSNGSYFNGVVWIKPEEPIQAKETLGEVSIEDFLVILKSKMDYDEAN